MVVALLGHVALLAVSAQVPRRSFDTSSVPTDEGTTPAEVIEIEDDPPRPDPPPAVHADPQRPSATPMTSQPRSIRPLPHAPIAEPDVDRDDGGPALPSSRRGDDFDLPDPAPSLSGPIGLSLRQRVGPDVPRPASTTAPRAEPVTGDDVTQALRADLRAHDVAGFENPEEHVVAAAVQRAMVETPVPHLTRARFLATIDAAGRVTSVRVVSASAGTDDQWNATAALVKSTLSAKAVPLGPEARRGISVVVDATLLHVYMSGSDGTPMVGPCPTLPLIGGEKPKDFFAVGGAPFLEHDTGTCVLMERGGNKHIEVRAQAHDLLPGAPPPGVDTFPKPPKRRVRLSELVFGSKSVSKKK